MALLADSLHFSHRFADLARVPFAACRTFVVGESDEPRVLAALAQARTVDGLRVVTVAEVEEHSFRASYEGSVVEGSLRSRADRSKLLSLGESPYFVDLTGLAHHIWAPLVRDLRDSKAQAYATYVEATGYDFHRIPTEGELFDLGTRVREPGPLPGFVSFAFNTEEFTFVPILGFEGPRAAFILEQVAPRGDLVNPIVGVPAVRPEYLYFSYLGNRNVLIEGGYWRSISYAPANCPFSVYDLLGEIRRRHGGRPMKVAPLGTKAHALGAVLYALENPDEAELVYDYPVRRMAGTSGVAGINIYNLAAWWNSLRL